VHTGSGRSADNPHRERPAANFREENARSRSTNTTVQIPVTAPADLIEACQTGNRAAFRRLFEAYRRRVYSTARHILGSDAAAKDATQQVFLTAWRHLARFQSEADFSPWLYRVAVNTCLSERRRLGRFADDEPPEGVSGAAQEHVVLAREVEAALGRLSYKLRVPLVLRHVEGLSYDEIAEVLGCSLGTVASRLSRGQAALARTLQRQREGA
jgi:RNA polymerase sigma-70 factor (ECF subfamily)